MDQTRHMAGFSLPDRMKYSLTQDVILKVRELSEQQNLSPLVALLGGWTVLLVRWAAKDDAVVDIGITQQRRAGAEPTGEMAVARLRVRVQQRVAAEEVLQQLMMKMRQHPVADPGHEVPTDGWMLRVSMTIEDFDEDAENAARAESQLSAALVSESPVNVKNGQVVLSIETRVASDDLRSVVAQVEGTIERDSVERMAACLGVLLDGLSADSRQPVDELPMLTMAEREQLLVGFNDTDAAYPREKLIHELFEERASGSPSAVAVIHERQRLSYSELNRQANQLARYLRGHNVDRDQPVGIYVERGIEMVVGLLGVLKAGGAYLPLDPQYPPERLAFMIEDASPRVILTQKRLRAALSCLSSPLDVVELDGDWSEIAKLEAMDSKVRGQSPRDLAYVIYTSGSTGEPKGVAAEHRGMVNRIVAQQAIDAFSESDICCQKTSIGFVDSIFEILGPLCYGRPLVIASAAASRDVRQLVALIDEERITRLVTVPTLAQSMLEIVQSTRAMQSLRNWTLSGEELGVGLLRKLQGRFPNCTFVNLYGSSEVAADVTSYVCGTSEDTVVPIGRPIANTRIYILDDRLNPVPIGAIGEIYVGGAGLAREYLHQPKLTAERFVADVFGPDERDCLYRTGDRGRWRADGLIEYCGRRDSQVKIRGFRVEPGEVEAQLAQHARVKDAVVIANEEAGRGKHLVAYVTRRGGGGDPAVEDLRTYLKNLLPEHMVPGVYVVLESLPLTPSGKVDRRALLALQTESRSTRRYEAPQGAMEQTLARVWEQLFQVQRVGRRDNFFELGGHSLLIVQMLELLRQEGLSADVHRVFESATLAELASSLVQDALQDPQAPPNLIPLGCDAITPQMLPLVELLPEHIEWIERAVPGGAVNIQDIYPLAPLQEGMLFHHLLDGASADAYVLVTVLSVASKRRLEQLVEAIQNAINRHDTLRTAVLWEQLPQPVQVVYRSAKLPVEEIFLDAGKHLQEQIREWIKTGRQRMDLRQAPLIRLQVAVDAKSDRCYAVLQMHHIVDDETSLRLLVSEIVAHLEGRAHLLPAPGAYRSHVAQMVLHDRTEEQEAYFRRKLADVDETTAPFGLMDVHGDGSGLDEAREEIDVALAERLRLQARRLNLNVATLFHAAWAVVVARTSGRDDVVFGSVLLGRLQGAAGAKRIVGMFVNTLPLRLQLRDASVRDLVDQTHQELIELLDHEQASLALAQRCSRIGGSAPLFSAVLNFRHHVTGPEAEWAAADGIGVLAQQYRTSYPITVSVDDLGGGFALTVQTKRRVQSHRIACYLQTALQSLADALDQAPQMPALTLEILPETERDELTRSFNQTRRVYPQDKLVHELFEEQARRAPGAMAVICNEQSLTYAQLNGRANQLARYLRRRGAGPDRIVAVCIERGLDMVVGLLAVLKAGGAYVPLDVTYPVERLAYMLEDSSPSVLLMQGRMKGRLPDSSELPVIALDVERERIAQEDSSNLSVAQTGVRADHLAYVIYTSGSTGLPKGVMVAHGNLINLIHWHCSAFDVGEGYCCSSVAAAGFDAAVWEIWPPLAVGASLTIAPPEFAGDTEALLAWWERQPLDVSFLPTPMAELAFSRNIRNPQLRTLLVGGDRLRYHPTCASFSLVNNYGPTEATVVSTSGSIQDGDSILHIGRPISNAQIYVLDDRLQPAPIAAVGEIYIGGAGVALGYLNKPGLTQERFIRDPFSADSGARLYRTGDLGRWLYDGTIEFLGRNDHQVKIRGYRIELGEIEAQLLRHPQLKEAAVVVQEHEGDERQLSAYIVAKRSGDCGAAPEEAPEQVRNDIVSEWEKLYDETYRTQDWVGPSFVGWNSSYTDQPIPESQMQEWLDCTVERIRALQPRKVLEIGCGMGLLLQHLAPQCAVYVGTDFSASALSQLRQWVKRRRELQHVELLQRSATELHDLQAGSFDTVILNSVVQYFPDIDYLMAVLREAIRLLGPEGNIFVGDVRNLGLLSMFHSAVQLSKAGAAVNVGQLKRRIARAVTHEKELVVDPKFFNVLPAHLPGVSGVDVQLRRGRAPNELTRYRYDAVLRVGKEVNTDFACEQLQWQSGPEFAETISAALKERRWDEICLHSIPSCRLEREFATQKLIEASEDWLGVGALRRQLNELNVAGVDPEELLEMARAHNYDARAEWSSRGSEECFDLWLSNRAHTQRDAPRAPSVQAARPLSAYANDPLESGLRQRLIPQLREYLKQRLPEYMVPTTWTVVKKLPLTPNGKLDRRALPAQEGRTEELGEFVAPSTDLELQLAEIWGQLLRVDEIGVQDNFFDLGGHSLLATQAVVRIQSSLGIEMPMRLLFEFPTIRKLAAKVDELREASLLCDIEMGGSDMEELIDRVATMPENEIRRLMQELRTKP